jgi:Holliday junction resolvasome RuvABC DNA-binding subunit
VSDDAVRALVALGYAQVEADRAVRAVVAAGSTGDVSVIVRAALGKLTTR